MASGFSPADGYRIGALDVSPGLVLAPMSGVTTSAFRRLVREESGGAVGAVVSEFVSVEGLTRLGPRSLAMLRYAPDERPVGIQIFGHDLTRMRDAAVMVEDAGADFVDVNCGCPAPKVVRKGGGCELMRQPGHMGKIFAAVRGAVSIPFTAKFRSGWDESSKNVVECARIAEAEGLDGVAVHGRTRAALYRGEADWSIVAEVAGSVRIPVFGSGDVVDGRSAVERAAVGRAADGVAGLFVGRAAIARPWVFREILAALRGGRHDETSAGGRSGAGEDDGSPDVLRVVTRYVELLSEEFEPNRRVGKIKQFASQAARGRPWAKDLCRASTFDEQAAILAAARDEKRPDEKRPDEERAGRAGLRALPARVPPEEAASAAGHSPGS